MRRSSRDRRYVWAVPENRGGAAAAEATEALRWLSRRLAFEQWLEELRESEAVSESAATGS
ncbi:MAG: hypothetical protein ABR600_13290 [Actinomycetota bacterium]